MSKRSKKPSKVAPFDDDTSRLLDELEQRFGNGLENVTIIDRAPWIDEEDAAKNRVWYEALEALDKRNNVAPLTSLLRSNRELDGTIRFHLADLVARRAVKGKRGAPQTPSYDRTGIEGLLFCALDEARDLAKMQKVTVTSLLDEVAQRYRIPSADLRLYFEGKRTSSRRMSDRRKPLPSKR